MKKDAIQKYIELLYSEASELNHIEDFTIRREKAADKAGLDKDSKKRKEIFELKNTTVANRIIEFLQKTQSVAYFKLIADTTLFWRLQTKLMEYNESGNTNELLKISEESEALVERIQIGYIKIYKQGEAIKIAEAKIRILSPEMRVRELNNSKNIA